MSGYQSHQGSSEVTSQLFDRILERTDELSDIQRQKLISRVLGRQVTASNRSRLSFHATLSSLNNDQLAHLLQAIAELLRQRQG